MSRLSNIKQYQALAISQDSEMQFPKIYCDWFANEYHQGSCNDFPALQQKGFCDPLNFFFNFSQPMSPSKSIFQPIWAIFRGHHTLHGMHLSHMHSSIQHPNMYSSTIMQHNQRSTPVIMHPNNVFILWHLKMIQIFIWPCFTKMPHWNFTNLVFIWSKSHASSQIMPISH